MGLLQLPSLGLSLLKAGLKRERVDCDIRYFNLEFVDRFCAGPGDERARLYIRASERYQLAFACEAMFSERLFGPDPVRDEIVGRHLAAADPDERAFVIGLREAIPHFIDYCLDSVDWERYRVLGLTTTFLGMTVPSVLLARAVKERHPHIVTVLGGPNTEGPMGVALLERMPAIDFVLRGECDESFPALVRALLDGSEVAELPGLVMRDGTGGVRAWPARPVTNLDAVAIPDFDDFVELAFSTALAPRYRRHLQLPFESSRGCWWGEVSHCKFCGINGEGMAFRAKSQQRVLDEIDFLVGKYAPELLVASDAILDQGYFRSVLPALAARRSRVALSYEIKAGLKRPEMEVLASAGIVEILPGIETFSTRILKLIDKGTTALDNLLCLRLAEEYGVRASWYHMCGLPFEAEEDYQRDIELIGRVPHLQPPREIARFTLQRFTPYFTRAQDEGIVSMRALPEYRAVFPFEPAVLDRLAYHFEFDFSDGRDAELTAQIESSLGAAVEEWKLLHEHALLDLHAHASGTLIVDTRFDEAVIHVLTGAAASIYEAIDRPRTLRTLLRTASARARGGLLDELLGAPPGLRELLEEAERHAAAVGAQIVLVESPFTFGVPADGAEALRELRHFLDGLVERGLAYQELDRYLALAVPRTRPEGYASGRADPPSLEVLA